MPQSINWSELGSQMLLAAEGVFKNEWTVIQPYATSELTQFTADLALITAFHSSGQLTDDEAKEMVQVETDSMKAVLLAVEGITELAVEQAIQACVNLASATVNSALGFALL